VPHVLAFELLEAGKGDQLRKRSFNENFIDMAYWMRELTNEFGARYLSMTG
jgi:hypothetical protein